LQPPVPDWVEKILADLREEFPRDRFEGVMRHSAMDPKTKQLQPANHENRHWPHKFVPRIRCLDCVGKVYIAIGFASHLKTRKHKEAYEARIAKEG
jgi:SWI/SNF-related matrix-associated actin-dependent regulator of chromatin subfamily B member 1